MIATAVLGMCSFLLYGIFIFGSYFIYEDIKNGHRPNYVILTALIFYGVVVLWPWTHMLIYGK